METITYYQVRRHQVTLGVFSTFWAADSYAKDKSNEHPEGSFVVGVASNLGRFVPSGFWKNGIWNGND